MRDDTLIDGPPLIIIVALGIDYFSDMDEKNSND